ncbi:hypothetical protein [Legionella nagasakiensis]|uniref:hypothetical protein n=1 Tax=Legionella nagasakiensis TaxID=535290 RepID=UPI001056C32D|nr:hypothetical protein [Legionella nagasakiensis]
MFRTIVRTARRAAPALGIGISNWIRSGESSTETMQFSDVATAPLTDASRRFPAAFVSLPRAVVNVHPWSVLPFSFTPEQSISATPLPAASEQTPVSHPRGISFTPEEVEAIRRDAPPLPLVRFNRRPMMPQGLVTQLLFYPYLPAMTYSPMAWLLAQQIRFPSAPVTRMPLYRSLLPSAMTPDSDDQSPAERTLATRESELTDALSIEAQHPVQPRTLSITQETIDRMLANPALLQRLVRLGQLSVSPVLSGTSALDTPPAFRIKLFGYSTIGELIGTPPVLRFTGGAAVPLPTLSAALTGLPDVHAPSMEELTTSTDDAMTRSVAVTPAAFSRQPRVLSQTLFVDPRILDGILQRPNVWRGFFNAGQLLISPVPGTTVLDTPSALSLTLFGHPTMVRKTGLPLQPSALQLTGGAVIPWSGRTLALPGLPDASPHPSVKASPHPFGTVLQKAIPPVSLQPVMPQPTPKHTTPSMRRPVASTEPPFTPLRPVPARPFTAPQKRQVIMPDEPVAPISHPLPAEDFPRNLAALDKTTRRVHDKRVKEAAKEVQRTVTALHKAGEDPRRLADELARTEQLLTAPPGEERDKLRRAYEHHGAELQKHPSRLWQALGVAMMVLGAAIAAVGVLAIVGTLGIGTAPGIGMAVGGGALLAAGIGLFAANSRRPSAPKDPEETATPDNTPG